MSNFCYLGYYKAYALYPSKATKIMVITYYHILKLIDDFTLLTNIIFCLERAIISFMST